MTIEAECLLIAAGDRGAFTRLYRATRPDLIRYATALLAGDRSAAEDAVDDAFVAIWQQANNFAGRGHAMGWIRRIVRNKAIDWLRKQRDILMSETDMVEQSLAESETVPTPFDFAAQASDAAKLCAMLSTLPLEQREAVWLCYFEEKSLCEIAALTDCPQNTVKTRLFHARKKLRKSGQLDRRSI